MNEIGIGLAGLALTLIGVVMGAAVQQGVWKEKLRNLESRMTAAEARQDLMRDQLARGDTAFAELRGLFNGMKATLDEIKEDVEKLLSR